MALPLGQHPLAHHLFPVGAALVGLARLGGHQHPAVPGQAVDEHILPSELGDQGQLLFQPAKPVQLLGRKPGISVTEFAQHGRPPLLLKGPGSALPPAGGEQPWFLVYWRMYRWALSSE